MIRRYYSFFRSFTQTSTSNLLLINDNGVQTLGVLDVDGLDVGVQLLRGVLLVVTSAGNADTESEGAALDTLLPDLLVQLGVDADILGSLLQNRMLAICVPFPSLQPSLLEETVDSD